MDAFSRIFYSFYLFVIVEIMSAFGVNIQLFKHENLTGFILETNSTSYCINVPKKDVVEVYSMRTDVCFIAYTGWDCKSRWTAKYKSGNTYISTNQVGRRGLIYSFHICNEMEGGFQLNVDLTKHYEFGSVLESYKNMCSCVNIPKYVQNMSTWSINNHHNDIVAYYEPDCSENKWNSTFIAAGHNDGTNNAYFHKKTDSVTKITYKFQSFGPDTNSAYYLTSCNSSHVTNKSPNEYQSKAKRLIDVVNVDPNNQSKPNVHIFESDALMKSLKKLWSHSNRFENSLLQSNWTCMSCFSS